MKMKKVSKIISLVLDMMLLVSVAAIAQEPKVTVTVGDAAVVQGSGKAEVSIPVTFEGSLDNLLALSLRFDFSGDLEYLGFEEGTLFSDMVTSNPGANPIKFTYVDFSLEGVKTKEGTFATLKFSVPAEEVKTYGITLTVEDAVDVEEKSLSQYFTVNKGYISVNAKEAPDKGEVGDNSIAPDVDDFLTEEKRNEERIARSKDVIALKLDKSMAYAFGSVVKIDPENEKVVPYLKNDRTLVPLRFVSETLGANVLWEEGWNYCYVEKDGKKIKITFNSAELEVDGVITTYEAPVEVVENRTMVPIRFISEELGYDVHWNQANQLVIITPLDNAWDETRQAEKDLMEQILVNYLIGMAK